MSVSPLTLAWKKHQAIRHYRNLMANDADSSELGQLIINANELLDEQVAHINHLIMNEKATVKDLFNLIEYSTKKETE